MILGKFHIRERTNESLRSSTVSIGSRIIRVQSTADTHEKVQRSQFSNNEESDERMHKVVVNIPQKGDGHPH